MFEWGEKSMTLKTPSLICALIMLTTAFVGCIPVFAESENTIVSENSIVTPAAHGTYNGPLVSYQFYDCTQSISHYSGLELRSLQMKIQGSWVNIAFELYQTGFQYLDVNGLTHNINLKDAPCTPSETSGGGTHTRSNTFIYQTVNDGKFTYIASITDNTAGTPTFTLKNSFQWDNTHSNNVQRMSVWWKIEWAINGWQGNGYNIGQKFVNANWQDIQVASYNSKGASGWSAMRWKQDVFHPTHLITATLFGGMNLDAIRFALWGDFGLNDDAQHLTDFYDYQVNGDSHQVANSLGSEELFLQQPVSGTQYIGWTSYTSAAWS